MAMFATLQTQHDLTQFGRMTVLHDHVEIRCPFGAHTAYDVHRVYDLGRLKLFALTMASPLDMSERRQLFTSILMCVL